MIKRICRPVRDSDLRSFGQWITSHDWTEVFSAHSAKDKSRALYATLQTQLDHFFPLKLVRLHPQDKPWITPAIKALIHRRQQAFVKGDTESWKHLRNKVQRAISAAKATHFNTKVKALKKEDVALWHLQIKSMANSRTAEAVIHVTDLAPSDTQGIANAINCSLSSVTNSLPPLDPSSLPTYLPSLPPPTVQPWEMYQKLLKVKTRKAAGPDSIPGKIIKEFAYELSGPLADILNTSLKQSIVPEEWKSAIVVPIPKNQASYH
ncbi:hypothetical protein Bbelb_373340 [Branchiostoma belcheri]|nr:hypothetical protein Bbelb_373340 [Branchiostoma belcheri]